MALTLSMCEVVAFVRVQSKAELALVRSLVVAHEIRILGDVDGLKCKFSQSLLALQSSLRL